jgi:hypothetical protein
LGETVATLGKVTRETGVVYDGLLDLG